MESSRDAPRQDAPRPTADSALLRWRLVLGPESSGQDGGGIWDGAEAALGGDPRLAGMKRVERIKKEKALRLGTRCSDLAPARLGGTFAALLF